MNIRSFSQKKCILLLKYFMATGKCIVMHLPELFGYYYALLTVAWNQWRSNMCNAIIKYWFGWYEVNLTRFGLRVIQLSSF